MYKDGTHQCITSEYFFCEGSRNADWALNNYSSLKDQISSKEPSAIVIHFGMNGPSLYGKTQELIEKLHEDFPNIQINMLKISHVAPDYSYGSNYGAAEHNSGLDDYNSQMSSWCSGKSNVKFIESATNTIVNENGFLDDKYKDGPFHLNNPDGNTVWYQDIISGLSGSSGASGSGTAATFQGFEDDQYVSSPVTGKVLEVGKHERLNVYSGELEEVEYIKILVPKSETYFNFLDGLDEEYEYESETRYKLSEAMNFFYDEYSDVCEGYIVMLDGFDVDLSIDGEDKLGEYEQNEVHALYNSSEMETRSDKEQAKEDAPFFIKYGETEDYPNCDFIDYGKKDDFSQATANYINENDENSAKGYYVKEGKYIGKTVIKEKEESEEGEETESTEDSQEQSSEETGEDEGSEFFNDSKLTYTYEDFKDIPGDYIRILIQDEDYAIVDDVESFFDIPEVVEEGLNYAEIAKTQLGRIFLAFIEAGASPEAAAGVVGNIVCEGTVPYRIEKDFDGDPENGYPISQKFTDMVDSGEITREQFVYDGGAIWNVPGGKTTYGPGYGFVGFTYHTLKERFI